MYRCILVATDGSELAQKAVQHAIGLADLTGAVVVALSVVPPYPETYFEGAASLAAAEIARIEKHWEEKARDTVMAVQSAGQLREVKVKPLTITSDDVGQTIIEQAKCHHCDLIVMASHGRSGLSRLLLGSQTQHVITHSHTPVLVLR